MKKSFFLFLLLFLTPTFALADLPRLVTKGNLLQTREGKPVTLRGVSLCSLEWHKPLQQIEAVTTTDRWEANVLRLPVQAKEWKRSDPTSYIKDRLNPAIQLCKAKNIYCIIDWHDIGEWNDPERIAVGTDFWKRVAPLYAHHTNILFEIFNEPTSPKARTPENWKAYKAVAQKWVDSIRRVAPYTPLLIGSPHWSQMPAFAAKDPLRGKNLIYTMHLYPNYEVKKWDKLFGEASATIPIFITEWGWSDSSKAWWGIRGTQEKYGEPLRAYLDARPHIHWTAWSYDPKCGPAMLGSDKDMGAFVKKWLEEVNAPEKAKK
jgi:hypothetical protein